VSKDNFSKRDAQAKATKQAQEYAERLTDPWWRICNLYKVKDKQGVVFTLAERYDSSWAQRDLYENMWYLNCILKARQLGLTTLIQLFILDRCLFNDNINAGVIAHTKEDAEYFFNDKIKFAYDNLPQDLRDLRSATSDTSRHLRFANGSQIRVGTSMRSGTYQYLHVSEFGKMCAKYPEKAQEVITGSLNTVAAGQFVFIESTAEGPFGEFYDMCERARTLAQRIEQNPDVMLTKMDYKFFFYPWWKHPHYALPDRVEIPAKLAEYFKRLEDHEGITLTPDQKAWYVKKEEEQRAMMKQEYPATPSEAFERNIEGAIYGEQLRRARAAGRICKLATERGVPVNTFWDLGRNDLNAIWFHQRVGQRNHFIYYYEYRLVDLTYYVQKLNEFREQFDWIYGVHYLPHDAEVIDMSSKNNESRERILNGAGLKPTRIVPRIPNLNDGIEITRKVFDSCWFDEEGCEAGLKTLAGYEYKWDASFKTFRKLPVENWAKNGADAFRQFAQGYRSAAATFAEQLALATGGNGGREYRKKQAHRHNQIYNPSNEHVV